MGCRAHTLGWWVSNAGWSVSKLGCLVSTAGCWVDTQGALLLHPGLEGCIWDRLVPDLAAHHGRQLACTQGRKLGSEGCTLGCTVPPLAADLEELQRPLQAPCQQPDSAEQQEWFRHHYPADAESSKATLPEFAPCCREWQRPFNSGQGIFQAATEVCHNQRKDVYSQAGKLTGCGRDASSSSESSRRLMQRLRP